MCDEPFGEVGLVRLGHALVLGQRRQPDLAVQVEDEDLLGVGRIADDRLEVPAQPGRGVALGGRGGSRVEEGPGVVAEARDRPDVDDVAGLLVDPALERIGLDRGDRVEPVVDTGGEVAGRPDVDDRPDDEDGDGREQQEVRDEPRAKAPAPGPGDAARRGHVVNLTYGTVWLTLAMSNAAAAVT